MQNQEVLLTRSSMLSELSSICFVQSDEFKNIRSDLSSLRAEIESTTSFPTPIPSLDNPSQMSERDWQLLLLHLRDCDSRAEGIRVPSQVR
jgi:hypothetical protein